MDLLLAGTVQERKTQIRSPYTQLLDRKLLGRVARHSLQTTQKIWREVTEVFSIGKLEKGGSGTKPKDSSLTHCELCD